MSGNSGGPEVLLRSALEKIVFFECRVASLESELDAARTAAARAREEASAARRRESEMEAALARARGEQSAALAQHGELVDRVTLLEAERERFLSGMVEAARVSGAPSGDGEEAGSSHDLAGFISELRAEIEELRGWRRAAEAAGVRPEGHAAAAPHVVAAPLPALATRFEEQGRIGVSRESMAALPSFSTRSERALYQASLDDLCASDPGARRRAADGLRALGSRTAAPLLAAALGRERETEVKVALLAALGALGEAGAADLAVRELGDGRPAVRAAALEAVSALARERATPQLAAALADPSPLVRRRATMLLGFTAGDLSDDALASALADRDAGVARAAAVALSGRPSPRAQGALARALDHREIEVRRIAARAVARWSGEAVDVAAAEPDRRSAARRISEKLLALGGAELRTAVMRVPQAAAQRRRQVRLSRGAAPAPVAPQPAAIAVVAAAPAVAAAAPRRAAAAVLAPVADKALASAALGEVRTALRGRTVEEVAEALGRERTPVEVALRALVAQGQLVLRGPRFFLT